MLNEYHVIYSVRYYLWFDVTAVGLGTFYPCIRGHCTLLLIGNTTGLPHLKIVLAVSYYRSVGVQTEDQVVATIQPDAMNINDRVETYIQVFLTFGQIRTMWTASRVLHS
jgi:hypothetical protein